MSQRLWRGDIVCGGAPSTPLSEGDTPCGLPFLRIGDAGMKTPAGKWGRTPVNYTIWKLLHWVRRMFRGKR